MNRALRPSAALVLVGFASIGLLAALRGAAQDAGAAREGFSPVQALQIVDCLLPGQVRAVGGRTYLTPRRPTRTTAEDCAARGGEYLVYDRADSRSALNVWLPAAEEGDAEAQTMVGEIYERGLGGEPSYEQAAQWYRRAAEQGNARAQFNLGTLYEQGQGVPADKLEALNWYRLASGLSADSVIFRSAAAEEQAEVRARLIEQLEQRDQQIEVLQKEIASLNEELAERDDDAAIRRDISSLTALLDELGSQRTADRQTLDALPPVADAAPPAAADSFGVPERIEYLRSDFGRYYALLIGVQDYHLLDDLASPANDIARVGRILEERYGFSVLSLADPDQLSLMRAVNRLNETLGEDDNLLIYFSGHGNRLSSGPRETGYWLPTNAEPAPDDTLWVPNEFVSRHLGRINARRVLIIADSCFSGLLGDDPGYIMVGDSSYTDEYITWKMPKRSRLVLSSGEDSPIVVAEQENSIFARALLDALETNDQVLTAPELFLRIREQIRSSGTPVGQTHEPALKALKDAGHEVGDFFFIPTTG